MPGLNKPKKTSNINDSGWLRTLRGGDVESGSSSDEGNLNDNESPAGAEPPSETQLVKELDISSRDAFDTAEFIANPWRIAKINAAVRQPAAERLAVTHSCTADKTRAGQASRKAGDVTGAEWTLYLHLS